MAFLSGLLIDVNQSRGGSCFNTKLYHPHVDFQLAGHGMETFSAWLGLCEGISSVTGGFTSQRASYVKLWYVLWY